MGMLGREWLAGADNAWRRMGVPENLTSITGMLCFTEQMAYEEFCAHLEERLLRFERFQQRIGGRRRTIRRPYWQTVDEFDIETHVHEINLRKPGSRKQLESFVGTLMSQPVDERRPLWQAYLIEEYQGGSVAVFRLNHSMADGFALLSVLLGLADHPEEIEFPIEGLSVPDAPGYEEPKTPADDNASAGVSTQERDSNQTAGQRSDNTDIRKSLSTRDKLTQSVRMTATAVKVGANMLLMDSEPQTSLHDDLSVAKRAAWTDEMDLTAVKEVGKQTDATVNDVLLGATAGVFRRTLEQRDEETDDLVLRCTVPVNLKPLEKRDSSLGNHFGLAFVPIPVGIEDLEKRIEFIRQRTSRERLGTEAFLVYSLMTLGGHVPEGVFSLALKLFEDNATAVVSNVPGPVDTIEIAGNEVEKIMFWNPQAVDQGLSLSIFTYDGGVRVGISGDANLIPEPNRLTDAFETEISMLEETYLE